MPLLINKKIFNLFHFPREAEFEKLVETIADAIFGQSTIYISKKKKIKGHEIISIPDGYLIDMTDPVQPGLYIIENEIVAHDAFNHIGVQLLRFATSFEQARIDLRKHLMNEIISDPEKLKRLETGCSQSNQRNIDSYLDQAVFGEFKALVVIDEARTELHNVIRKINADISVLEVKTYKSSDGEFVYQFDSFYDEDETEEIELSEKQINTADTDAKQRRRERRAKCDTIVVPAQEDGFQQEFLQNNQWYAIRIGAAMKEKIKYIAAYQVAPVSAITYIAEIDAIIPYKDTGKYLVKFKGPARPIGPIGLKNSDRSPQSPIYIKYSDIGSANSIDDLVQY